MMMRTMLALAVIATLTGCAATSTGPRGEDALVKAASAPREVAVVRGGGLERIAWGALIDAAAEADVVLLGELHEQPVGQAFEGAFFEDLLVKAPKATAAMEFYERDQQAAVDDYLAGITDEAAFRTATRRPAKDNSTGHWAMIQASKAAKRPVIAANSPRRYVRLARTDGFDRLAGLSLEQRRLFAIPLEMPTGRYRDDFIAFMAGGESQGSKDGQSAESKAPSAAELERIEASFRSQSVWDATMAESVANAMNSQEAKPVVLVVGKFHVANQGGLYQALRRLRPGARVATITLVDAWSASGESAAKWKDEADYLVLIGETESSEN